MRFPGWTAESLLKQAQERIKRASSVRTVKMDALPLPKPKAAPKRVRKLSAGYPAFVQQLTSHGIAMQQEYRFDPDRKWRFDFADHDKKLAVEVEGGVWINGRHNRGSGFLKDISKYNQAVALGWRVLRVTPQMIKNGQAIRLVLPFYQ